jgi:hypothetical protein
MSDLMGGFNLVCSKVMPDDKAMVLNARGAVIGVIDFARGVVVVPTSAATLCVSPTNYAWVIAAAIEAEASKT